MPESIRNDLQTICWVVQWTWFAWVNALCNLSRKKLQELTASLSGRFLSRHCLTLCITMEVEPRIVKQYEWHHCCRCKNYWGKGMEGGKKRNVFASFFWLTRRSWVSGKKCVLCPQTLFFSTDSRSSFPKHIFSTNSRSSCQPKNYAKTLSYSTSNKSLLVARHILTTGLQKCLVGSVKFANSLSPPSIMKKVCTGSKSSQGT